MGASSGLSPFAERAAEIIRSIRPGQVATYGQIAGMAGNRRAARQIARLLHSASSTRGLPWHRVVNSRGGISLPEGAGYEEQRARLEAEGVEFDLSGRIDLGRFRWGATE